MTTTPWVGLPPASEAPSRHDPDAEALGDVLMGYVALATSTLDQRSRQVAIGSSEVGWPCDRRVAFRLAGVPATNLNADPMRRIVGNGVHMAMADLFRSLDHGVGWFKVEFPVIFRDVPGTADLVYCFASTVVDWKSTTKGKIAQVRREGVPKHYQVQAHLYAAGLNAKGIPITHVAVVYLATDGTLRDRYVWRAPYSPAVANDAVDRIERLRLTAPADATALPDRLCRFCAHYAPGSVDLNRGCPGNPEKGTTP